MKKEEIDELRRDIDNGGTTESGAPVTVVNPDYVTRLLEERDKLLEAVQRIVEAYEGEVEKSSLLSRAAFAIAFAES